MPIFGKQQYRDAIDAAVMAQKYSISLNDKPELVGELVKHMIESIRASNGVTAPIPMDQKSSNLGDQYAFAGIARALGIPRYPASNRLKLYKPQDIIEKLGPAMEATTPESRRAALDSLGKGETAGDGINAQKREPD